MGYNFNNEANFPMPNDLLSKEARFLYTQNIVLRLVKGLITKLCESTKKPEETCRCFPKPEVFQIL